MGIIKLTERALLIVVLLGSVSSLGVFHLVLKNGTETNSTLLAQNSAALYAQEKVNLPAQAGSGLPIRLKIPKISVDAAIESVGLTSQGAVAVTKGPTNAAWFNLGPRPGEKGSSIIDGHSGWKNGIPAVFDNLYKLHKGDEVYIQDEGGKTVAFVVRKIRTYSPSEDASAVFDSSDGKAHLNLITCTGVWNKFTKSSSERLVIFTDME